MTTPSEGENWLTVAEGLNGQVPDADRLKVIRTGLVALMIQAGIKIDDDPLGLAPYGSRLLGARHKVAKLIEAAEKPD